MGRDRRRRSYNRRRVTRPAAACLMKDEEYRRRRFTVLRWKFILFVISAAEVGFYFFGASGGPVWPAQLAFFSAVGLVASSYVIGARSKTAFRKTVKTETAAPAALS